MNLDNMDIEYKYQVIDNFLDDDAFAILQSKISHTEQFPWFFSNGIAWKTEKEILWDFQFVHTFYNESLGKSTEIVHLAPLLKKINPKVVHRLKANLGPITDKPRQTDWHTDFQDRVCTTAVFYLNTNNGYTAFKNGEKVESVANRLLTFDSRLEHAGVSCTDKNFRAVINLNYEM
jgi:hypothetical protein